MNAVTSGDRRALGDIDREEIGMMKMMVGVLVAGALLMTSGCAAVYSPAMGMAWMDVKGPLAPGDTVGPKTGRACAKSYLGIVATGDASIAAAAAAGGITKIQTVDHHTTHKVFIGEFCTVVHGS